jgi:hypothetical protein
MPRDKHPGLFLILVLALSCVPVFQAAHALTHVDSVHETHVGDGYGSSEVDSETYGDVDRVCIDCLALTAFSIIFSALAIFFSKQTRQRNLLQDRPEQHLSGAASLYFSRAPPRG